MDRSGFPGIFLVLTLLFLGWFQVEAKVGLNNARIRDQLRHRLSKRNIETAGVTAHLLDAIDEAYYNELPSKRFTRSSPAPAPESNEYFGKNDKRLAKREVQDHLEESGDDKDRESEEQQTKPDWVQALEAEQNKAFGHTFDDDVDTESDEKGKPIDRKVDDKSKHSDEDLTAEHRDPRRVSSEEYRHHYRDHHGHHGGHRRFGHRSGHYDSRDSDSGSNENSHEVYHHRK